MEGINDNGAAFATRRPLVREQAMIMYEDEVRQMFVARSKAMGVDASTEHCWPFKLFHPDVDVLKSVCNELISDYGFGFSSVGWNRIPTYQVEGWVCKVFVIKIFSVREFHQFILAMDHWISGDLDQNLAHNLDLFNDGECRLLPKRKPVTYSDSSGVEFQQRNADTPLPPRGDIIEFGPDSIPKRIPLNATWEARWAKSVKKEMKELVRPNPFVATPVLDNYILITNTKQSLSPWLHFCAFELKGPSVFVCDMRPGPSDDGVSIALKPGMYDSELQFYTDQGYQSNAALRLIAKGAKDIEVGEQIGTVSTDLATLGFYDQRRLRACFHYDSEEFFYWGEAKVNEPVPWETDETIDEFDRTTYQKLSFGVLVYDLKRSLVLPFVI